MSGTFIYKDRILWLVFYPLAAVSFIFIANDNPLMQLIKLPSFVTDVAFALLLTYGTGIYIKWMTLRLDQKVSWHGHLKKRTTLQFLYGMLLPLLAAMALEVIYLKSIGISFSASSVLNLELPLAFLLLLLVNGYYFAGYLFHNKKTEVITIEKVVETTEKETIPYIVVQQGFTEVKINIEDCALIKSAEKLLWLYTFNNESYRLTGTLDEWEQKLKEVFFRINRQYLASPTAVQSVSTTETRKLKVDFTIPVNEAVYISKANAAGFRKWWKNECPL